MWNIFGEILWGYCSIVALIIAGNYKTIVGYVFKIEIEEQEWETIEKIHQKGI